MTRSCKILIAGEADLRASLVEQFALLPEFAILEADTHAKALEALGARSPDMFLFDAGGERQARRIIELARSSGFDGLIVLLADKEADLPSGADDCVVRPLRFAEFLERVRRLLRRRASGDDAALSIGPYVFRPDSLDLVHEGGKRLRLTEKEAAILSRLSNAGGAAVSRDVLLREVWGYNPAVATRTLETHIYRLRQKIELDPSNARLLLTERGGYRLISRSSRTPREASDGGARRGALARTRQPHGSR